jgi:hypothetical protein
LKLEIREPREGWTTLRRAIPDGVAKAVASRLHVCADHVRRWRREPLSDDAPLSSGQRSPLDRLCDLLDAVFLSYPVGAALIVEHVRDHYDQLLDASLTGQAWDRRAHAAKTLREAVEAVNCLNLDSPDEETISELVQAREVFDQAILEIRSRRPGVRTGSLEATEPVREVGNHNSDRLRGGLN